MKNRIIVIALIASVIFSCADNELDVSPNDQNFPFQIVLDTDEGGDLAGAEDYGVEIKFADYIGSLPDDDVVLTYELAGADDFEGNVSIDKVVYEVEIDDCTFERELAFNAANNTITLTADPDLESLPESIEVVVVFPSNVEGSFTLSITNLQTSNQQIVLGGLREFEYSIVDNDVAGSWELSFDNEEEFELFKNFFAVISADLAALTFNDIDGGVKLEFGFGEAQFEITLNETEEVCAEGETETENKTIDLEADYEAEDGELVLEGSHVLVDDDGNITDELDFIVEATYEVSEDGEELSITFTTIIDEDNFRSGEELFAGTQTFTFKKD